MKTDLGKDIENMKEEKRKLEESKNAMSEILALSEKQMDSTGRVNIDFFLTTRTTNDANYVGFKSSGKIGYMESMELKSKILSYYQENMQPLYDMEKFLNSKKYELVEILGATSTNCIYKIAQSYFINTIVV